MSICLTLNYGNKSWEIFPLRDLHENWFSWKCLCFKEQWCARNVNACGCYWDIVKVVGKALGILMPQGFWIKRIHFPFFRIIQHRLSLYRTIKNDPPSFHWLLLAGDADRRQNDTSENRARLWIMVVIKIK